MQYFKTLKVCFPFNKEYPKLDFLSYENGTTASKNIESTMRDWYRHQIVDDTFVEALRHYNMTEKEYMDIRDKVMPHMRDYTHPDVIKYDNLQHKLRSKTNELRRNYVKNLKMNVFDNVPIEGFKFITTVSRYSTSNKLFRVYDSRVSKKIKI